MVVQPYVHKSNAVMHCMVPRHCMVPGKFVIVALQTLWEYCCSLLLIGEKIHTAGNFVPTLAVTLYSLSLALVSFHRPTRSNSLSHLTITLYTVFQKSKPLDVL